MRDVDRYTPGICYQLRQIAEHRQWSSWNCQDFGRDDLMEDLELTYHLHRAAEASGARAGMAPMPPFPLSFNDREGLLDPAEFIKLYSRRVPSPREWNQLDNETRTEWFNQVARTLPRCVTPH